MAEVNPADLKEHPSSYRTSRAVNDVLIGEDTAVKLIDASSTGDVTALQNILEHSPEMALESPHRIYQDGRDPPDDNGVRYVQAMKTSNLGLSILRAAENGHAAAVSTLLAFASQNDVKPSSIVTRQDFKKIIECGHAAVFDVLAKAEPSFATLDIIHGRRPLDFALTSNNFDLVKVVLDHGGAREFPQVHGKDSYPGNRLCKAAKYKDKTMTELLIQHGYTVIESGALQMAAARGALDTVRLLVEKHGADVNEQLPAETLPRSENALYASWTPMHFAARYRQEEAMNLLEGYGALTDVVDVNGKTPSQLLEEQKELRKES
jgi:hypothetical protein